MIPTSVLLLATMAGVLLGLAGLAVTVGIVTLLDRIETRVVRVRLHADVSQYRAAMVRAAGKP